MFEFTGITSTDIRMTRGDTEYIGVNLFDGEKPYELQPGDKLVLSVRKNIDAEYTFQLESDEMATFFLDHDKTANLDYGTYVYDIQLSTADGGVYTVIWASNFILVDEVTR